MWSNGLNFDFSHLASNNNADVQVFHGGFPNNSGFTLHQWTKPKGVTMCYMICIGGGGGGGLGKTRATTLVGTGGGGGASGGASLALYPACFLPDSLKVLVGRGGPGGGTNGESNAGSAGVNSFIAFGHGVTNGNVIPNVILQSGATALATNAAATGAAGGAAGAVNGASTLASIGSGGFFSIQKFLVGVNGAAGGVGAVGAAITAWAACAFSGGGGGAGIAAASANGLAGGAVSLQAALDFCDGNHTPASGHVPGGTAAVGAGAAGDGNSGVNLLKPFFCTGGSGGGSADQAAGGKGGNGGIGCGGGGGGAGTTGGKGGNGGEGLVVIISW